MGQIVLQGQYASAVYWVGAAIVFLSFLVVNHESKGVDDDGVGGDGDGGVAADGVGARAGAGNGAVRYDTVPGDEERFDD